MQNISPAQIHRATTRQLVDAYLLLFPKEGRRLDDLVRSLSESFRELANRQRELSHITASALVMCRKSGRILVVKKPSLMGMFQPGGHIIDDDLTPLHAAYRHLTWRLDEGFVRRLTYVQWDYDPLVPMDIDIHAIAKSSTDGEPPHKHIDFRYLFWGDEEALSKDTRLYREHDPMWVTTDHLGTNTSFSHVLGKLNIARSPELARKRFYSEATRITMQRERIRRNSVHIIAVAHIIPDVVDYLLTLRSFYHLGGVIAKPKSLNGEVLKILADQGIPVVKLEKGSPAVEKYLDEQIGGAKLPVVLIDIGGWFSGIVPRLASKHKNKLVGVVEDTENGYRKYLAEACHGLAAPVYSVARSPLKDYEDFLIGKSIVFSADSVLRAQGVLLEYLNCSVIGYGKIGKSIAEELVNRGIRPTVYDKDATRRLDAYSRGCKLESWSDMLSSSDVVFSATGGQATDATDFKMLKNGCYVFSVTSADDEFNFTHLLEEFEVERVNDEIDRVIGGSNYINLVCKGNAVNFLHGACVGDFIHLARSEMIYAAGRLAAKQHELKIYPDEDDEATLAVREKMADTWIRVFLGINDLVYAKDSVGSLENFREYLKQTEVV